MAAILSRGDGANEPRWIMFEAPQIRYHAIYMRPHFEHKSKFTTRLIRHRGVYLIFIPTKLLTNSRVFVDLRHLNSYVNSL